MFTPHILHYHTYLPMGETQCWKYAVLLFMFVFAEML